MNRQVAVSVSERLQRRAVTLILLLAACATLAQAEPDPLPRPLFVPAEPVRGEAIVDRPSPEVVRARRMGLHGLPFVPEQPPTRLIINLFPDVVVSATLQRHRLHARGGLVWIGRIDGHPGAQAVLLFRDGKLFGRVGTSSSTFHVRPSGGLHHIAEIDESAVPRDRHDYVVLPRARTDVRGIVPKGAATTARIDLLMLYTPAARDSAGGHEAILAELDLATELVNTTFENSAMDLRVRLVHAQETAYTETSNANLDVERLRGLVDGFMDEAHALRDTWGADVVGLWAQTLGFPCGIAFQMLQVSPAFANQAFLAVRRTCGGVTLAHELGHTLAARHDWLNDDTSLAPYSYNHGHSYDDGFVDFDTIMAITGPPRILYWSNPDILVDGIATGVPAGTSTACRTTDTTKPVCDADNRLTLSNSAPVMADFRPTRLIATLRKTVSGGNIYVGDPISYTLVAENLTEQTATGIVISDVVPEGTRLDAASLSGDAVASGTGPGSQITWTTGVDLAPGASLTRTFTVTAAASMTVRNVAGVGSTNSGVSDVSNAVESTVLRTAQCGFFDDFETGALGPEWLTETTNVGRVRVIETDIASGSFAAVLDNADSRAGNSEANLILVADLTQALNPRLGFQWVDGADEYDPDFDGAFIREAPGDPWIKVFDFAGSMDNVIQSGELDLAALIDANGLAATERFQVRFGFRDNFPFQPPSAGDGYLIDNVSLECEDPTIFTDGFESPQP